MQKWNWPHSRGWTGITIDDCWKGWAILLRQKQKKLIMLPSETMIWQPEFTDKTLSRKPGAVHIPNRNILCSSLLFIVSIVIFTWCATIITSEYSNEIGHIPVSAQTCCLLHRQTLQVQQLPGFLHPAFKNNP